VLVLVVDLVGRGPACSQIPAERKTSATAGVVRPKNRRAATVGMSSRSSGFSPAADLAGSDVPPPSLRPVRESALG
jgi:hypothetical protein